MSATSDPSVPNREGSSLAPNPTGTPALSNQDILQAVEEPPPYTPRPDLRTGEATVEYGPARPFQPAPQPPQHGAQGGWPPPQQQQQQQQYRPPPPPQRWAGNAGYPGAMRRDQIPGGWPPPQQQQQQQWGPPTAGPGLQPRPSIYGVFRDGVPARGSQIPPSPTRTGPTAPPAQSAKDAAPSGSASSELEDARPTTSPVPGHPFLRNGQILVYPSSFECHKCLNTGYKNFDPHHPCRGCWEKYGKPYTGAVTYAPFSAGSSSHSQISLQRPLPRQPPSGPAPPTHSAPATVHGHMPGAYPPSSRPWMPAPPPGATVVQPGDPRIGGRLCYRCMGEGTISVFIFDTAQCPACGGLGRILG